MWDTRLCWGQKSGQRGRQGAVADDPSSTRVTLAKEHGIPPCCLLRGSLEAPLGWVGPGELGGTQGRRSQEGDTNGFLVQLY